MAHGSDAGVAGLINNGRGFCLYAYREDVRVVGRAPDIMNTDQGIQFIAST